MEPDEDLCGFRTLLVIWNGPNMLEEEEATVIEGGRFDDPAVAAVGQIAKAMQAAMLAILTAAEFTVRLTHEADPSVFGVEVLESSHAALGDND